MCAPAVANVRGRDSPCIGYADGATPDAERPSPQSLRDLPPSAKLVFEGLETEAPLLQADVHERTRLSTRTTRHAIALLRAEDLVAERVYVPDAR